MAWLNGNFDFADFSIFQFFGDDRQILADRALNIGQSFFFRDTLRPTTGQAENIDAETFSGFLNGDLVFQGNIQVGV